MKWEKALNDKSLITEPELELATTPVMVSGRGPVEPGGQPLPMVWLVLKSLPGHRRSGIMLTAGLGRHHRMVVGENNQVLKLHRLV